MRRRIPRLLFLCLTVVPLAVLPLAVLPSCIYADIGTPLDIDLDNTSLGDKVGEASSYGVMWAVAWGDAGTRAAAEQGGITTITHADRRILSVLWGLYYRQTTIVYGK